MGKSEFTKVVATSQVKELLDLARTGASLSELEARKQVILPTFRRPITELLQLHGIDRDPTHRRLANKLAERTAAAAAAASITSRVFKVFEDFKNAFLLALRGDADAGTLDTEAADAEFAKQVQDQQDVLEVGEEPLVKKKGSKKGSKKDKKGDQ